MQEELAELIQDISKFKRGRINIEELAEEMADVKIVWVQLYSLIFEEVDKQVHFKMERLRRATMLKPLKKYNEMVEGNLTCKKYDELRNDNEPSSGEIIYEYGKWNKAKKEAGIEYVKRDIEEKRALEVLLQADKEVEGFLSMPKFEEWAKNKDDAPSSTYYHINFRSWNNAKRRAGLKVKKRAKYSDEELIQAVKKANKEIDNITVKKYKKWSRNKEMPCYNVIYRRIGTIEEILNGEGGIKAQFCRDCPESKGCDIQVEKCEYYKEAETYFEVN